MTNYLSCIGNHRTNPWHERADKQISTCQPTAVAVAAVSFILWIYAIGDTIWGFAVSEPIWISAGIAIWTIAVPYFYKG